MKNIFFILLLLPFINMAQTSSVKATTYKIETSVSLTNPTSAQALEEISYLDGLGRPIQNVYLKGSNAGKNIVTHFEYEANGKNSKQYLPYVSTNNSLIFESAAKANTLNYPKYVGDKPFAEQITDDSPENRILKKSAPGNSWTMGSGNETAYVYSANTVAENVKIYTANASWNATTGVYDITISQNGTTNYAAQQLFVTTFQDEHYVANSNNNTTKNFTDKFGRLILKRRYESNVAIDTYYVYDQFGNLTFVLPPNATNLLTEKDNLCYQYKYDDRNRLVEKKLPGKAWEYMIYDKLDRIVASGPTGTPFEDGHTNAKNLGWMIFKYDIFGRVVYTGWYDSKVSTSARWLLQKEHNVLLTTPSESKVSTNTIDGVTVNYSNLVQPVTFKLLSVNYYDDYQFPHAPTTIPLTVCNNNQEVYYNTTRKPKGLLTGSWVRVLTTSTAINADKSYNLYDKYGRIVRLNKQNYNSGYTQIDAQIDFIGNTIATNTAHKRNATAVEIKFDENFTYDNQNRLKAHWHDITGGQGMQLLKDNTYDDFGNLILKKVGRTARDPLQVVNYDYNIRGWLKEINKIDNLTQSIDPKDLFALKINYNEVETTGTPQYNGNISEIYWKTANDNVKRKYSYSYDALNRLKNAVYQKPGNAPEITNSYNEAVNYDTTGNITSLQRNGQYDDNGGLYLEMDNLTYTYHATKKNQLMKVADATIYGMGFKDGTNTNDDYDYDSYGNLTIDRNKGINVPIKYNHLNLPIEIIVSASKKVNYVYNAFGKKLKKTVTDGSTITTTEYNDGFQYVNNILSFFPTSEGYVRCIPNGASYDYRYAFNYTDHLGNIRISYGLDPATNQPKILEENNYYPFGLKHNNYNMSQYDYSKINGNIDIANCKDCNYYYKFNGKEWQEELGLNVTAMDFRQYDNAIGRFNSVDQLAELDYGISSYSFARNNPIGYNDPTGLTADAWDQYNTNDEIDQNLYLDHAPGVFGQTVSEYDMVTGTPLGGGQLRSVTVGNEYQEGYDRHGRIDNDGLYDEDGIARAAVGLLPIIGGGLDFYEGVKNGNALQATIGVTTLAVDLFTFGSASILVGSIKMGTKAGAKAAAKELVEEGAEELAKEIVEDGVFIVTKEGVVLPKGAKIPKNFIENANRSSNYGVIENGKYIEKVRIDAGTPAGFKGPNESHFHLNNGNHIFDGNKWPWW